MERTKPPALTSPWKIGFFVSLMLVFVAIGVAYFFTRTLGSPWSWPQVSEWRAVLTQVLRGQGFLVDSWPLLVLVGATSLISYLVITQAVRKYKRYLDSGHDYKRLLGTIREIEDLDDIARINELHNHPELREFLTNVRNEYEDRTRMLNEREKALESRVIATEKKKEQELASDLNEQCGRLIEAIVRSRTNGFPDDVGVTLPELTLVEDAIRNALAIAGASGELGTSVEQQSMDLSRYRNSAQDTCRELEEMSREARELEAGLIGIAGGSMDDADGQVDAAQHDLKLFMASCRELEKLSAQAGALGEETRSVAINTALHAGSGRAKETDLVQLAEDVKELAASYGALSKAMAKQVTLAKRSASNVGSTALAGGSPGGGAALSPLGSKLSMLAERLVVVTEKFKHVWDAGAAKDSGGELVADARDLGVFGSPGRRKEPASLDSDDGFESLDGGDSIFSSDRDADEEQSEFETSHRGFSRLTGDDGLQEDDGMFAELSDRKSEPSGERVEISEDEFPIEEAPVEAPRRPRVVEPEAVDHEMPQRGRIQAIDTSGLELDGFGGQEPAGPKKAGKKTEAEIIDLYELGAVDYDPVAHG